MSFQDAKLYIDSQKQGWGGYLVVQAFTFATFAMGLPAVRPTATEEFEQREFSETMAKLDKIFTKTDEAEATTEFVTAYNTYFVKERRSKRCETIYTNVAEKFYGKSITEITELKGHQQEAILPAAVAPVENGPPVAVALPAEKEGINDREPQPPIVVPQLADDKHLAVLARPSHPPQSAPEPMRDLEQEPEPTLEDQHEIVQLIAAAIADSDDSRVADKNSDKEEALAEEPVVHAAAAPPPTEEVEPGVLRTLALGVSALGSLLYHLPSQIKGNPQQPPAIKNADPTPEPKEPKDSPEIKAEPILVAPAGESSVSRETPLAKKEQKKPPIPADEIELGSDFYHIYKVETIDAAIKYFNKIPASDFTLFLTKAKIDTNLFRKEIKQIMSRLSEEKRSALGKAILATREKWALSLVSIYDAFIWDGKAILSMQELLDPIALENRFETITARDAQQGSLLQRIIIWGEWSVLQSLPDAARYKLITTKDSTDNSILTEILLKPEQWEPILKGVTSEEERLHLLQTEITKRGASILSKAMEDFERSKQMIRLFATGEKQFTVLTTEINGRSILSESTIMSWEEFKQIVELFKPDMRFKVMTTQDGTGKSYLDIHHTVTVAFVFEILKLLQGSEDRIAALKILFSKLIAVDKTPFFIELIKILTQDECKLLCTEEVILAGIPPEMKELYLRELYQKADLPLPIPVLNDEELEESPTNYSFIFQCIAGVTTVAAIAGFVLALVILHSPIIAIACGAASVVALSAGLYRFFSNRKPAGKEELEHEVQVAPVH